MEACLEQGTFSVSSLDALIGSKSAGNGSGRSGGGEGSSDGSHGGGFNLLDLVASDGAAEAEGEPRGGDYKGGEEGHDGGANHMRQELRTDLSTALSRLLDDREKQCLVLRYGLEDGVTKTEQEVGRIMGLNLSEVRMHLCMYALCMYVLVVRAMVTPVQCVFCCPRGALHNDYALARRFVFGMPS